MGTPAQRLPSLTGLRFFASFLVFLSHAYYMFWFTPDSSEVATRASVVAGSAGVAFFFLLSGFVLTWSSGPSCVPFDFWRRRMMKIYPNHLVAWCLALLLMYWMSREVTVGQALPSILLVHSWLPSFDVHNSVNGVSWSLSCELVFYLCFPLLLPAINKLKSSRLMAWGAGNVVAIFTVPVAAALLVPSTPKFADLGIGEHQQWFAYIFPGTRLLEFVLGILLARMVREGRLASIRPWHAVLALAAGGVVALYVPLLFSFSAVLVLPFAITVVTFANNDVTQRRSVLRSPPLVWLGEISFAFYLLHGLVMDSAGYKYGHHFASGQLIEKALWCGGLFVAAVACSWVLYMTVERPMMRRFGARRPPADGMGENPREGHQGRPSAGMDVRT